MKNKLQIVDLAFLAICIATGMVAKKFVSPFTNVLTDFIRIPGGGAATAFSVMFLTMGCSVTNWPFAGTVAGFVQGMLAIFLGMSSYQGLLAIVTYTVPGIMIDIVRKFLKLNNEIYFMTACCVANTTCAFVSNLLVFHLQSMAFVLWMLVAASFGIGAGVLGNLVYQKLGNAIQIGRTRECVKNG